MSLFKRKQTASASTAKAEKKKAVTMKEASHDFIKASKAFEQSRIGDIEKSKKIAWRVAIGACCVAVVNAIAIVGLTPLKEVSLYVIRVDNNTGATDIVTVLDSTVSDKNLEISKYFASLYVQLMESYDWYTLQTQVNHLMMFSDKNMQNRINTKFARPDAPHKLYENTKRVEVAINNVSVLDEQGLLQVRFTKTLVPVDGGVWNEQEQRMTPEPEVKKYIATIGYDYVNVPTVDDVRLVNPLGFTVVSYRVDEEFGG